MAKTESTIDFAKIGEEVNIILLEIYGQYIAEGSPTKLGGLRFLNVESGKTFAFESCIPNPKGTGNLLVLSAPFTGNQQVIEKKLKAGKNGKKLYEAIVRTSKDKGKGHKYFVEPAYELDTDKWLTEDNILKTAKTYGVTAGEAIRAILRENVMGFARSAMDEFIGVLAEED